MRPKVLVIRLSSMGDVVLSTSVVDPFRRAGVDVSFVTKSAFAPLLQSHPEIRSVFSYSKEGAGGEREARESFFRWVESEKFDFILDLQDSWRTRFWRFSLRKIAPVYVARKERLREWLILFCRLGNWFSFGRGGRARKFRRAAVDCLSRQKLFASAKGDLTTLHITEEERAHVSSLLPKEEFAVLLPGSAWKGKEWPYFSELAAMLASHVPVVTLGSEKDLSCDDVAERARALHRESRSLRGKTNLRESMAVISQAKWVIGNDTGMVHVAEALGKSVAMLEGPTHEYMGFSPYRENSVLLGLPLVCRPCSKTGRICPRFGTYKCLNDLSPERVVLQLRAGGYPC